MMLLRSRALRSKKGRDFFENLLFSRPGAKSEIWLWKKCPKPSVLLFREKIRSPDFACPVQIGSKKSVALAPSEAFTRPCAERAVWPLNMCPRASVFIMFEKH